MRISMTLCALLGLAASCKQKTSDAPSSSVESASAAPGDAAPGSLTEPVTAKTGDQLANRYEECIGFANAARWDEFKACYVPGAKFEVSALAGARSLDDEVAARQQARLTYPDHRQEPQLVLVRDDAIVAIELHSGTHASSKRPIGIYVGHVIHVDPAGTFTGDTAYFDAQTIAGQLARSKAVRPIATGFPKVAVIAKRDAVEETNLSALRAFDAADQRRDLTALGALLADDLVWSRQFKPTDLAKAAVLDGAQAMWKRVPNKHTKIANAWAAGDYVATTEVITGTPTGPGEQPLRVALLAVQRFVKGQIAEVWVFAQAPPAKP